jgi:2-polyprenyl-3-methyl-5-hydroxy-6-metoxy-1,4-benzoquinol methylase
MAYDDFVRMYAADVKSDPETLLAQRPLSFPMSSNQRGKALVDFLQRTVELDLEGKRVLDVGCAYGGLSIALAQSGAKVSALDVSNRFIDYANVNAEGCAHIDFHIMDASSVGLRTLFPKGSFDLIILNDVLEHIYDTTSLVANLDWLLNDTGSIYFKVPNGFSPRFALSEGHRKIFGLTLLDPDCWFHLYPKRASIFYRPLAYFSAIFSYFRLGETLFVDEEQVFRRFTPQKIKNQIKEIYRKAQSFDYPNATIKVYLRHGIGRFRDEYAYDLETYGDEFVRFKYGSYFFTGFASRPGANLRPRGAIRSLAGVGDIVERGAPSDSLVADDVFESA